MLYFLWIHLLSERVPFHFWANDLEMESGFSSEILRNNVEINMVIILKIENIVTSRYLCWCCQKKRTFGIDDLQYPMLQLHLRKRRLWFIAAIVGSIQITIFKYNSICISPWFLWTWVARTWLTNVEGCSFYT